MEEKVAPEFGSEVDSWIGIIGSEVGSQKGSQLVGWQDEGPFSWHVQVRLTEKQIQKILWYLSLALDNQQTPNVTLRVYECIGLACQLS